MDGWMDERGGRRERGIDRERDRDKSKVILHWPNC